MSWTLLESQTLSGSQASITLGSGGTLNQGYKTLKVMVSARSDRSATYDNVVIKPNNATSNRSYRNLEGDGSTAYSQSGSEVRIMTATGASSTASTFSSGELTIPNYASTTATKPMSADGVHESNATAAYQDMYANLWNDTTAITSLVIIPGVGPNFVSGTTVTLYGLK